jgi:hypothetical protein
MSPLLETLAGDSVRGYGMFSPSAASGNFTSIQTVTVGAGGASAISFSSIPSTYTHLQIRGISKTNYGGGYDANFIQFNGDTSTSNYVWHRLAGTGSSAGAAYGATGTADSAIRFLDTTTTGGTSLPIFGTAIVDILDYTSTTKTKTVRSLNGYDQNGSGVVSLNSGLWLTSNAAITSITITDMSNNGSFQQYSTFALYGVK